MITLTVIAMVITLHMAYGNPCIEFQCSCTGTAVLCKQKNLTDVPDGIPNTTTILNLQGNQISNIAADAFNGLTALTSLSLEENQISNIAADAFNDLTALETLRLNENNISITTADMFKGLVSLTFLHLGSNQIETLAANTFKGLVSLRTIYLNKNKISTVAADIFKDFVLLSYIDFSNNDLTTISSNIFRNKTKINSIYLNSNPLICCKMTDFIKWISAQTDLRNAIGTCFDFDAKTNIKVFDILNCSNTVDGQWSSWSTTSCTVTCGTGTEYRNRMCNNPTPSDGEKIVLVMKPNYQFAT